MNHHDPVCDKVLRPANAVASVAYEGNMYHFCSQECHGRFWANPEQYVGHQLVGNVEVIAPSVRRSTPLPWHLTE
jgi:YHS domain-containing protein